jgi:glyoxylase I family protein
MRTRDVAKLETFYARALGFEVLRRDAARGSVWLEAGGAVVMIERAAEGEPAVDAGSMDLVAFAVDDKEAWRARLEAAGVRIEDQTEYTLYFRDPDGRRVGVSAFPLPVAR